MVMMNEEEGRRGVNTGTANESGANRKGFGISPAAQSCADLYRRDCLDVLSARRATKGLRLYLNGPQNDIYQAAKELPEPETLFNPNLRQILDLLELI